MLRLDGACALASSLAYNQYITYLDLSYNGLGRQAGELLGNALLTNQTLETLLLMNNNLNFSACFTLCVAVEEHHSLKRLQLDGNPIGEGGGRILMTIPSTVGGRVKVSANGCNILIKDQESKFDLTSPDGVYELTMENPYDRAIAYKLLRLIASHETYVFHRFAYLPDSFEPLFHTAPRTTFGGAFRNKGKGSNPFQNVDTAIPINALEVRLEKVYSNEKAETLDEQQIELLKSLRQVEAAANNLEIAQKLFAEYDTDGSGSLDRVELHSLLSHVGLKMDLAVFDQAVDMFDIDGSGTLEVSCLSCLALIVSQLDEFLGFLKSQREEAASRIRDILEFPVMVRAGTTTRYVPPTSGKLFLVVGDSYTNRGRSQLPLQPSLLT
jgi:Ca2+-binding EF-hand superfamily protein